MKPSASRVSLIIRSALGILIILAISLGIFIVLMSPPIKELGLMAFFLALTALVSTAVGYGAYRLGWLTWSPTLRWTLLAGYILASLLTFFNVWFSARMMFASEHDLVLSIVLLIFAGGIATVLGYFLSSTVSERILIVKNAAEKLAKGDLQTRVSVDGYDEVGALANSFNQMAGQLQAADRARRDAEQMRTDLIAWASHDLQTPLASIRAILEALADKVVDEPESVQRYLLTAQRDVRSLSMLIDDLFQMAQLDAGGLALHPENSSLSDLISDTLESFSQLADRQKIRIVGSADANIDPVAMDTMRIGRVLNNLIGNALRYTPAGGQIEVRARRTPRGVEVSVSDSGEGIPIEDQSKIFERFYRGEKSRSKATGGSGLGLAISRGIVRAHGGDILVESKPGKGSCFTFYLP
jgi:signal transduction histidine kinase